MVYVFIRAATVDAAVAVQPPHGFTYGAGNRIRYEAPMWKDGVLYEETNYPNGKDNQVMGIQWSRESRLDDVLTDSVKAHLAKCKDVIIKSYLTYDEDDVVGGFYVGASVLPHGEIYVSMWYPDPTSDQYRETNTSLVMDSVEEVVRFAIAKAALLGLV